MTYARSRSRCSNPPRDGARRLAQDLGIAGNARARGGFQPRYTPDEVRRAALALFRAVERRLPALATSKWWKEERHGVFIDYNQNAKDRTTCSAYSLRPTPDARISALLRWDEVLRAASLPTSRSRRCPPAFGSSEISTAGSRRARARSMLCSSWLVPTKPSPLGDAPRPPHFSQARLGIDTGRPFALQELGGAWARGSHPHAARRWWPTHWTRRQPWPASSAGNSGIPRSRHYSRSTTAIRN